MTSILFLLAIFCVSGIVQGATGFGFGLVAVSLMSLLVDIREASVMLAPASLAMNLFILMRLRGHFRFGRIVPMFAGAVIGVPIGIWFLFRADPEALHLALACLLLVTVVQNCIPGLARKQWHPVFLGVPCGLLSGVMAGAFASGGPPAVAYVVSQRFDRLRYAATLQMAFALSSLTRILILGGGGVFTRDQLALAAAGMGFAVFGAGLGLHLLRLQSDLSVRRVVLSLLALLAVQKVAAAIF